MSLTCNRCFRGKCVSSVLHGQEPETEFVILGFMASNHELCDFLANSTRQVQSFGQPKNEFKKTAKKFEQYRKSEDAGAARWLTVPCVVRFGFPSERRREADILRSCKCNPLTQFQFEASHFLALSFRPLCAHTPDNWRESKKLYLWCPLL